MRLISHPTWILAFISLVLLSSVSDVKSDEEEPLQVLTSRVDKSTRETFDQLRGLKERQENEIRQLKQEMEKLRALIEETALDYEALSYNEIGAYEELPPTANFTLSIHNIWTPEGHLQSGRTIGSNYITINYNPDHTMNPGCMNLKGLSPNRHVLVFVENSCVRVFTGKNCGGAYATFTHPRVIKPYSFSWRSVGPCKYVQF